MSEKRKSIDVSPMLALVAMSVPTVGKSQNTERVAKSGRRTRKKCSRRSTAFPDEASGTRTFATTKIKAAATSIMVTWLNGNSS